MNVNRADTNARLYRESEEAKTAIKALRQRESAELNTLKNKVKVLQKNKESVQQYRHEANSAYAEARKFEKQSKQLTNVVHTLTQK